MACHKFIVLFQRNLKKQKILIFLKSLHSDTLRLVKAYLENGTEYNKQINDSLKTNKLLDSYSKIFFLNESKKQFYIVYKKLSAKEIKAA